MFCVALVAGINANENEGYLEQNRPEFQGTAEQISKIDNRSA